VEDTNSEQCAAMQDGVFTVEEFCSLQLQLLRKDPVTREPIKRRSVSTAPSAMLSMHCVRHTSVRIPGRTTRH
jgi:hypothetical protein